MWSAAAVVVFLGCSKTPEAARKDLAQLNIPYSVDSFVKSIQNRDEVAINLLLDSGIDVNGNRGAPLIAAVRFGSETLVRRLIKSGAKINARSYEEYGAIDYAAESGQLGMIKLLVEAGATIDPKRSLFIRNTLDVAEENNQTEVVQFLIKKFPMSKAEANQALLAAASIGGPRLIRRYLSMGADLECRDKDGKTPLMLAKGSVFYEENMKCLLELGAKDSPTKETTTMSTDEAAVIKTASGDIVIEFWPDVAPNTVENFKKLTKKGFYDGTAFHRIVKGFMIQGGDPLTKDPSAEARWGTGDPGYKINAEFNDRSHTRGVLSMARSADPNSAGSQFFICLGDASFLDQKYTAFGKLIKGDDVLTKLGDAETVSGGGGEKSKPVQRQGVESIKIVPADRVK